MRSGRRVHDVGNRGQQAGESELAEPQTPSQTPVRSGRLGPPHHEPNHSPPTNSSNGAAPGTRSAPLPLGSPRPGAFPPRVRAREQELTSPGLIASSARLLSLPLRPRATPHGRNQQYMDLPQRGRIQAVRPSLLRYARRVALQRSQREGAVPDWPLTNAPLSPPSRLVWHPACLALGIRESLSMLWGYTCTRSRAADGARGGTRLGPNLRARRRSSAAISRVVTHDPGRPRLLAARSAAQPQLHTATAGAHQD